MANPSSTAPLDASGRPCSCSHGIRPLGRLHGVNMGSARVRLSTTPGCPTHDACQGYTAKDRADRLRREAWDKPWCPIHGAKNCPERAVNRG